MQFVETDEKCSSIPTERYVAFVDRLGLTNLLGEGRIIPLWESFHFVTPAYRPSVTVLTFAATKEGQLLIYYNNSCSGLNRPRRCR